jgi:hypothetical protein
MIEDMLTGTLLGGYVFVVGLFVERLVADVRRHHPLANRRFLARHRAKRA